jgi:hypothetical protein
MYTLISNTGKTKWDYYSDSRYSPHFTVLQGCVIFLRLLVVKLSPLPLPVCPRSTTFSGGHRSRLFGASSSHSARAGAYSGTTRTERSTMLPALPTSWDHVKNVLEVLNPTIDRNENIVFICDKNNNLTAPLCLLLLMYLWRRCSGTLRTITKQKLLQRKLYTADLLFPYGQKSKTCFHLGWPPFVDDFAGHPCYQPTCPTGSYMSFEDRTPTSIPSLALNGIKQNIRILWPWINTGKCGSCNYY